MANREIGQQLKTATLNIFDKPDNHLDPLDFNGHVQTSEGGEACVPQACTDIPLIGEVCFPPFKLCAGGEAHAGLSSVSGLSTVAIKSINITKFDSAADDNLIASGKIAFAADAITAAGFAGASCDLAGIDIPVDASCSATLRNLQVNGDIRLEVAVDVPTLKKIDLDNLSFSYGAFDVSISGLGPSIT